MKVGDLDLPPFQVVRFMKKNSVKSLVEIGEYLKVPLEGQSLKNVGLQKRKPRQTAGLKADQDYFVEQFDDLFDPPFKLKLSCLGHGITDLNINNSGQQYMCNSLQQDKTPATKSTILKLWFSVTVPLTAHCHKKFMGDSPTCIREHKPIIISSVGVDNSQSVFRNFH